MRKAVSVAVGLAVLVGSAEATAAEGAAPQAPEDDRQQLVERIDVLEKRLAQLEAGVVMSEPETRVRRKEVWVDENGVEHDEPVPGARRTTTYQRETAYRRQSIGEKIEEALAGAEESRVQLGVDGSIVLQALSQTSGPDVAADGHAYELASADLFFTAGLAQNTLFFADVVGFSGSTPDEERPDALLALNGYGARLDDPDEVNLREAWIQTQFFDERLTLVGGRLDLTNYFDGNAVANDETTQFISDPLVVNPMLGLSSNGAGLTAIYDPSGPLTFKIGVQQSSEDALSLSDAIYSLGEIGYKARPFGLLEGNYRAWYRRDNSSGSTQDGYGVSFDQRVSQSLSLFARYGRADAAAGHDQFYSGGVQLKQGWVFNPEDAWGLAFAQIKLEDSSKESVTELYYNLNLAQKLRLTGHVQYAKEQPVAGPSAGYLVTGLRFQASF